MKYKYNGQWNDLKIKVADTMPIGTIIPFGSDTIPANWLLCDGRAVSRTTYAELFAAIGTSFGSGDGSTTFNLPNFKGRVPVGKDSTDTDFDTLGETGGSKTVTLTVDEMPAHTHAVMGYPSSGGSAYGLASANGDYNKTVFPTNAILLGRAESAGGGQPHNNLQPYIVVNYIIKAFASVGVVGSIVNTETSSTEATYSCNYVNDKIDELDSKIPTNAILNIASPADNMDEFKSYLTSNAAPVGVFVCYLNFGGSFSTAIVSKTSNLYISFIHFSYGLTAIQYSCFNGVWSSISLG